MSASTLGRIARRTPVTVLARVVPVNHTVRRGLCGGWYYGRHHNWGNQFNNSQHFQNNMRNFWKTVSETMENSMKEATTKEGTIFTRSNVVEKSDAYKIIVEMPGVSKEGVEVKIEDGRLLVKGRKTVEVEGEAEEGGKKEAKKEIYFTEYDISHDKVEPSQVKAKLENGILEIVLPKSVEKKSHVVNID